MKEATVTILGSYISTQKGFAFKSEWYTEEGRPIVKVSDFTEDSVDTSSLINIPEEIAQGCLKYELKTRDVIIQTVGSWPTNPQSVVGKVIRIPASASGALLNQNAVKVVPNECLENSFLFYLLKSPLFKEYIVNTAQGAASQASITLEAIKGFKFELPSLPTQRKIAGILSAYDDLIENNSRRIEILEGLARLIYREWFVQFRFPGHEGLRLVESAVGPVPERWEVKQLADFGEVITGKTPSKEVSEYYGNYMPFIKTPSMHGKMFIDEVEEYLSELGANSQKSKTLPPNTLIVNCIGALAGSVSITITPSQTNQQINAIVLDDQSTREFLYFTLVGLKETIRKYGSTGATMINLSKGKFEALQVISPDERAMPVFHQVVCPMFEQIKNLQQKNANLRRTRDLLLPRLISGEVDVGEVTLAGGEETSE